MTYSLDMFPAAPIKHFTWAPVFMEPMHGSGERIVIAVIAAGSGTAHVEVTVTSQVLKCMFGGQSGVFAGLASLVAEDLQEHFATGGMLAGWHSPIEGATLGEERSALADSAEEAARSGAMLVASLWRRPERILAPSTVDYEMPSAEVERWLDQIRTAVLSINADIQGRFNYEFKRQDGISTRVGYMGGRIVANFDALVPGSGLSKKRQRAKSRLLDLQIVRDLDSSLLENREYELMLWLPSESSVEYSERMISSSKAVFAELEEFGLKHDLRVRALNRAEQAAEIILKAEA